MMEDKPENRQEREIGEREIHPERESFLIEKIIRSPMWQVYRGTFTSVTRVPLALVPASGFPGMERRRAGATGSAGF